MLSVPLLLDVLPPSTLAFAPWTTIESRHWFEGDQRCIEGVVVIVAVIIRLAAAVVVAGLGSACHPMPDTILKHPVRKRMSSQMLDFT